MARPSRWSVSSTNDAEVNDRRLHPYGRIAHDRTGAQAGVVDHGVEVRAVELVFIANDVPSGVSDSQVPAIPGRLPSFTPHHKVREAMYPVVLGQLSRLVVVPASKGDDQLSTIWGESDVVNIKEPVVNDGAHIA